jgi:hypothetical protein
MSSSSGTPPPHSAPAGGVLISGSGNTVNVGGNFQTQTTSVRHWYTERMDAHKWFYWILHFIVAVMAAAAWEYRAWLLHFMK